MENFSLQRIGRLLRKDAIEYKKNILYVTGASLLVMFALLYSSTMTEPGKFVRQQNFFFFLGTFGSFLYFCRFAGNKMHRPKGIHITLPASAAEKYTVLLLEWIFIWMVFNALFWSAVGGLKAINPSAPVLGWTAIGGHNHGIYPAVFLSSLLFLSYLTFRKYAGAIFCGGVAAFVLLMAGLATLLLRYVILPKNEWKEGFLESVPLFKTLNILADYGAPVLLLSTGIVLYVAYLKFKEKEIR